MKGEQPKRGPNEAGHPHYAAPTGQGVNVNVPPQFGGEGPVKSVTGSGGSQLGIGGDKSSPKPNTP